MHRKNFIVWYYSDGLKSVSQAIKNLLKFIPRFFSMKLLSETLFSLWKRNVLIKDWQGFNFFKSTKYFINNFYLRFVGFFIRIFILFLGVLSYILTLIFGILFFIYFFCFPAVVSLGLGMCFSSLIYFGLVIIFIQLIFLISIYRKFQVLDHYLYQRMSVADLSKMNWFKVYERLGVKKEDVPEEVLLDYNKFKDFLNELEVTEDECEKIVLWEIEKQEKKEEKKSIFSEERLLKILPIGLYWHFGETPILDSFAIDLTRQKKDPYEKFIFVGYEEEMDILESVISRKTENNALLVGLNGSGRKMIVNELARKIKNGLYNQSNRIIQFNSEQINNQIKKAKIDPEVFLDNLFQEVVLAGNVILVIDELEKCLTIKNNKFSFANILYQYAQFPSLRIIGITNEENIDKNKEDWLENFEIIYLSEMNEDETIKVLFNHFYSKKHTPFTFQALRKVIDNSQSVYPNSPLPSRAISLAQNILDLWQKEKVPNSITAELIGIYLSKRDLLEKRKALSKEKNIFVLENSFYEKIVGQDLAINSLVGIIRRMREDQDYKLYSFLFFGPDGVGKTEIAKVFSEQYFNKEKIVEVDVKDFLKDTKNKLLGFSEKNQVGFLLHLTKFKNTIIFFQNLEQANNDFVKIFSFILKNGFVKDNLGQEIDLRNLVFIFNFNADFLLMKNLFEKNIGLSKMKELIFNHFSRRSIFTSDFFGKFSDIILFFPFDKEEVYKITEILLNKFSEDFQNKNQVEVYFDEKVIYQIIENGFDENLGARSLKNYIESEILDFLTDKIIRENIQRGTSIYFTLRDMK